MMEGESNHKTIKGAKRLTNAWTFQSVTKKFRLWSLNSSNVDEDMT